MRDCESGCKSCITRSARLKISTQNTSVTYDVSRARQSGGGAPTPRLAPATNSAMSVPAPAIRWKQFIRERERERDASSELLSPDLISVPAIPGNFAGHEVGDTSNLLVLGAPDAPIVQISCVTVCQCVSQAARQNAPSQLTPDHHNVSTCAGGRVSPAAEARVSSNVGILTPGDL